MERIGELGFFAPIIVLMALYAGIASIAFAKKMKIAGIALAILFIVVIRFLGVNDIVKNVLVFFLVLFFLPYTVGTWIAGFKNRFLTKR